MNVFGVTKKSINFFVNMFDRHITNEDNVNRYVEVEYPQNDWEWIKDKLKDEKQLKKIV
jgi:hypothetical protein|tara:strand:- start:1969 stop:2145 length:177 start_codon:yes stop_codon:yes gene_type:complete